MSNDPWKHRSFGLRCKTCMWFVPKSVFKTTEDGVSVESDSALGRCRRHAPNANGFIPVFESDWCGDHRLDENKTIGAVNA